MLKKMKRLRVLNLYAGIGGNRKLWPDSAQVTAIESDEKIASVYAKLHPEDKVECADAHEYLRANIGSFDFIWSSPPCQSHSQMAKATRHKKKRYVDLRLYEQIMFLQRYSEVPWVVENVRPWYTPLVAPKFEVGRHLFWSTHLCNVQDVPRPRNFINLANLAGRAALQEWLGIHFCERLYYAGNHCPAQVLRNAVHPEIGKQIFNQIFASREFQTDLFVAAE